MPPRLRARLFAALLAAATVAPAAPRPVSRAADAATGGALAVERPFDADYRAALELVYDGAFAEAEERLAALAAGHPDDPVGPYLQALALCWRIEQETRPSDLDRQIEGRVRLALSLSDAALRRSPAEARARLARGAAHGVWSRYLMFRARRRDAAREAVRMREDLLIARAQGVTVRDVSFGLGLYDYFVDVLPRFFKLLRFFTGMPGGDRERGLALITEAREGALFHETEARVQLFEIAAYYEGRPTAALEEMRWLRARYPGWPRWGLKLAEHLRDRLGLYAEGAAVAREVLSTAETGAHPNYQPVVAAMARVGLGESLLLDLRFGEARQALLPARDGSPQAPELAGRARLALGRCLEHDGDRAAALEHYRFAASSADPEIRRQARAALGAPMDEAAVRAAHLLAEARRRREAGEERAALRAGRLAFEAWPPSDEARLLAAEDALAEGRLEEGRSLLGPLVGGRDTSPPFVRPLARLPFAETEERRGAREGAVRIYKELWQEPWARPALRERAAEGLRRAASGGTPPS